MALKAYASCIAAAIILSPRTAPAARFMACPRPPQIFRRPVKFYLWTELARGLGISCNRRAKPMADERTNYTPWPNEEPFAHPPQYHVIVLLVDDQLMVCEAVR